MQIFVSQIGIQYLSESQRWQGDGTFFSAPKPFKQVYMIFGAKSQEKLLPCVYVLMQNKSFVAYKELFDQLKYIAERYGYNLSPKFGHTDFEHAVRKALRHCYPGIHLRGCYFHFKQAVGRWMFQHGFKMAYSHDELFRKWAKKLHCLAVVPIELQSEAF